MNTDYAEQLIHQTIRTIPDWPSPGVMFRDITPLFQNPTVYRVLIDAFVHRYIEKDLDVIAGIDARGFILSSVLAYALNVPFVPIRKKGKLPYQTIEETYQLEYGHATVQIHADSVKPGDRVLIVDDLIATGGTMLAAKNLLQRLNANVLEACAIIDLPELGGSAKLNAAGLPTFTLTTFDGH